MSIGNWQAPSVVLGEAQRIVEATADFGPRAANWEVQKAHEAEWAIPVIFALQELEAPGRVLDLGPGYGTLAVAATLLGHEVVAIEGFLPPLVVPGVEWIEGDLQRPGAIPNRRFELVVMTEVLEHLNYRPEPTLRAVYDAMGVGGVFVGSTPLLETWEGPFVVPWYELLPEYEPGVPLRDDHMACYSQMEVLGLLKGAGFAVREQKTLGSGKRHWWRAEKQDKDPQRLCTDDFDEVSQL